MHRELFEIPFLHLSVKSYGFMVVVGFLAAIWLIKKLSKHINSNPEHITNAALYALIAGVIGARIFYVVHYFDRYQSRPLSVFYVWEGGLELLGGVFLGLAVLIVYMKRHKLPIRLYFDILAIALMLALSFGRIGCFLNGCCYGKPTDSKIGVVFPYDSPAYLEQIYPDPQRGRMKPYTNLPDSYFDKNGYLKPYDSLSKSQQEDVTRHHRYCNISIHPTQLYSSGMALFWSIVLYLFWKNWGSGQLDLSKRKKFGKPGSTFGLMFILYGPTRFVIEFIRDDNPFEAAGLTISQFISIAMVIIGVVVMVVCSRMQQEQEL